MGHSLQDAGTSAHPAVLDHFWLKDLGRSVAEYHPDLSRQGWYLALQCSLCTKPPRPPLIELLKRVLYSVCMKNSTFQKKENVAATVLAKRAWSWVSLCVSRHDMLFTSDCYRWAVFGITAFSQIVVVPCAANSALHKCKREGIMCLCLGSSCWGEKSTK